MPDNAMDGIEFMPDPSENERRATVDQEVEVRFTFKQDPDGRAVMTSITLERDHGLSATLLRRIPFAALLASAQKPANQALLDANLARTGVRSALEQRKGGRFDDRFYRDVAILYRQAVVSGAAPGPAIAAAAGGIPVRTAHRWIARARQLGHLGPGRQGRTG